MADNQTSEAAAEAADKPAKKAKEKTKEKIKFKTKPSRVKPEKALKPAHDFDFVGKVESLHVKSGAGAESFEFSLKGRHGKRGSFRFDAADTFALNAMAQVVLAAHASGAKIGVRTGLEVEGVLIVREVGSRPKFGKGA